MNTNAMSDLRPSPIAGFWYSADPAQLTREIEGYLQEARQPAFEGQVVALVLPHAGHFYSGLTAAHALKAVVGKEYQRVIIVSPSHQPYRGHVLTSQHEAYQTPLGLVPVDHASLAKLTSLLEKEGLQVNAIRRDREHAIEIELPFLQHLLPKGFQLIPLMLMDQSLSLAEMLSDALVKLISGYPPEEKTLLIASSDLSHFYQQDQANRLDRNLIEGLQNFEPRKFYQLKSSHKAEACGHGALASVLLTANKLGARQVTIADYRTSGDVSGDHGSVVGYVSAIISTGSPA